MGIITKGMGAIIKKLGKNISKDTRARKLGKMIQKGVGDRNVKSKELLDLMKGIKGKK